MLEFYKYRCYETACLYAMAVVGVTSLNSGSGKVFPGDEIVIRHAGIQKIGT